MYIKDEKRFKQVRKGNIMITNFKEFETPTGVKNYYYSQNTKGKKINLKDIDVVKIHKRYLPKKQADKMKKFARKNYNK